MIKKSDDTDASRQYAAAYAAHYSEHDLHLAMRVYRQVVASHPSSPEAEYSRMQIQNIVNTVVPKQKLLDAQMKLAMAHFEHSA